MSSQTSRLFRSAGWLPAVILVLATVLAYHPVWQGEFVWDDDLHVSRNRLLVEDGGLKQIWSSSESPQYYPMVFTSFRLERSLWGLKAAGYHWVNLLLHAASAVLLWRILRRLNVPGSWLAAAVFAMHPVNVESVAWISQRKNILAMFFYLLSLLWYLRFDPGPRPSPLAPRPLDSPQPSTLNPQPLWYWLSVAAFVLALLSKTAVAPLPIVLLGLAWWRRGKVTRRDVLRSAPFFTASLVLGLVTIWFERHQTALLMVRDDSFWSRLAGAGWAVWFYLYKAVLPLNLTLLYPRWTINASDPLAYVPGMLLVGGLLLLWWNRRRWGRVWLFCAGYYVVMLLPTLGFVNIGFMSYSLVADHWQYFAIIAPIAVAAAVFSSRFKVPGSRFNVSRSPSLSPFGRLLDTALTGIAALALLLCGYLTWRQAAVWRNNSTLWAHCLAVSPGNQVACYSLGLDFIERGKLDQAVTQLQEAIRLDPAVPFPYVELGKARALQGKLDDAMALFAKASALDPGLEQAHFDLGNACLIKGNTAEAVAELKAAVRLKPANLEAQSRLAEALIKVGRAVEALPYCEAVVRARPRDAHASFALAEAYLAEKRPAEALTHLREAARLAPGVPECLNALAWVYATCPQAELRNGAEAVRLAEAACRITQRQKAPPLDTLAAAYAEAGRFEEAIQTAEELRALALAAHDTAGADTTRQRLELYRAGKPYRDE